MGRRLTVLMAGAVLLVLALAAPAVAATDTPVPYGWMLQLRNKAHATGRNVDMTYRGFRALANANGHALERSWVDDNKTPDDLTDDLTYKGLTLKRLVAQIDDGNPATFNTKRALAGYMVTVEALDGFTATYTSEEVRTIGAKVIVADRVNDLRLPLGTASIDDEAVPPVAEWKPTWPLKFVSGVVSGKQKPGAAVRISIVPAVF